MTTTTATVTDTNHFRRLSRWALEDKRNRIPSDSILERLDTDGVHLMTFSMVHNDVEMRTMWLLKVEGEDGPVGPVFLDMSFEDFNSLTQVEV